MFNHRKVKDVSDYDEMHRDLREVRKAGWGFMPMLIGVIVILALLGFGLNSLGLLGRTTIERKVFEESYQRSSAIEQQIATDEAALAEVTRQLQNPNLDEDTRANLEAQASAARVRIDAAKRRQ